ncbi:MAG: DHH family phosphoesterase [Actinomycetota bacterium]|jgi:phosphoesterase RecJ-like protein|nr:DHH family phosphoesterase [Actinomycetota bacterium]
MPETYHRAAVELKRSESVVICAHVRPDGDAMGSVLGLTVALRDAGISAVPTLADPVQAPSSYSFLPGFSLFAAASELETPDVFVALDTPNLDRLGVAGDLARKAKVTIVLDHHFDNAFFGDVNVVDTEAAATGQMLWRLLDSLAIEPSSEVALCLYVALMTDTGRFQYDNTDAKALRAAAEMLDAGVDASMASRLVYQERSAASIALEARALSRLTLANGGRVAYTWIDDMDFTETGAHANETETLPDAVRTLGGIDVSMLLRVRNGEIRGNLRAKTGFDVGSVAREFGGGGHRAAAGFTHVGTMGTLLERILPLLPTAPAEENL